MRFDLNPSEGIKIAEKWLNEHSQDNWGTILRLLKSNKLTLVNKELKAVTNSPSSEQPKIVHKYRGVEIPTQPTKAISQQNNQLPEKKRRYRGVEY